MIRHHLVQPALIMPPCWLPVQAAADTLAMSSLEVDLSNIQEGQTVTVKWRGKPVFIRHRCAVQVAHVALTIACSSSTGARRAAVAARILP
jgi:Rieske Fe-S protein